MAELAIDGPKLMRQISLTVNIRRAGLMRLRLRLMLALLRFAALVGGVGFEVIE